MNTHEPGFVPISQKSRTTKTILIVVAIIAFMLLLVFFPGLILFLAFIGIVLGIIALIIGKVPGLAGSNRKTAAKGTGAAVGALIAATIALGLSAPDPTNINPSPVAQADDEVVDEPTITTESATPTPPPTLEDYVGEVCDADDLVMEQGAEKLYCDENTVGTLVWLTAEDREKQLVAQQKAEEEAKAKAAAEKAEKEAAAKKAAEEKAAQEKAAAEKAAAEKAAAKKAAAEKAAAEKAAAEKKAKQDTVKKSQQTPKSTPKATKKPAPAPAPKPAPAKNKAPVGGYKNCTEARNAGAAPVYRGDPGYAKRLDRDGDGIGCE